MSKFVIIIASIILFASCKNADLAPLYENRNADGKSATRAFGPLYENITLPNGHERIALRPLWSYEKLGDDRVAEDFLWPLAMSRRDKDYYRSNFLLFF